MDQEDKNRTKGKVWLVGAGPGDMGLLTLKGKEVLGRAEVVIYDALVGTGILSMMPDGAEKIYVGKRASLHSMKQEDISRLIFQKAMEGKRVVRLKGGDPFVFGRGGEELELLVQNGIPYEIVPGVTSAFAVPAYAGIPVTHRDHSSSVHVITGHRRKDHTYDIDFASLTEAGGTLVFLMGISSISVIADGLLSAGMDPETPAAIIERGTTASQRRITSTLDGLAAAAEEQKAASPAIIVIGETAELADDFAWREMLPLSGVRAIVTRPKELSSGLASMLRELGAETVELPAIRIEPVRDNTKLIRAIRRLKSDGYEWIVFTSPSGVRVFMDELLKEHDVRALSYCSIAAIGRGTEKELLKYGLRADMVPSRYDGRTLGNELADKLRKGDRVLIPRARMGNLELTEELVAVRGVMVDDIPTYDTAYVTHEWFDAEKVFSDPHTYALFTSASTVRGFVHAYPGVDRSKIKAVCIGRQTAAEAASCGMETFISDEATLAALVRKLEEIAK